MAQLIIDDHVYDLPDGSYVRPACEKAGVVFDCNAGVCGSCVIHVTKGAENLSELSKEERDLGMDKEKRLACQAVIKQGDVEVTF